MKRVLKIVVPVLVLSVLLFASCVIIPPGTVAKRILIDDIHGNSGIQFSSMKAYLEGKGYTVNYASQDGGFFPVGYGGVIIPKPTFFGATDLGKLDTFYKQHSGGILLLGDWDGGWNFLDTILVTLGSDLDFGTKVANAVEIGINVAGGYFANHPTTSGLTNVNFVRGCSVTLPQGSDAIKIIATPVGSFNWVLAPEFEDQAAAITEYLAGAADTHILGGKIFAFGSIDSFTNVYLFGSDNEILLTNIMNWLM